jgi:hypothetical protein
MIQQYKSFSFNGTVWSDLLNVTLSNDFYIACLRGARSIKEEKIPGRDIPYFYEIDDEPLEFEVNFATEDPLTKGQIKTLARALLSHNTYRIIHFGDVVSSVYTRKTPFFNVIFTGEPDFNFIGAGLNNSGNEIYHGYFTLQARADRPYGYVPVRIINQPTATIGTVTGTGPYLATITGLTINHGFAVGDRISAVAGTPGTLGTGTVTISAVSTNSINISSNSNTLTAGSITNLGIFGYTTTASGFTFINAGDIEIAPGIIFKNNTVANQDIQAYNSTNNTAVTFSTLENGEQVTISAALRTISSTPAPATNIYSRWLKNELVLEPGTNVIQFQRDNTDFEEYSILGYLFTFEAPSYILGD